MLNLNLTIVTKNIFKLLEHSGLSNVSFTNLLGISEKQIRLIKKGKAEFNIENINKACEFFNVSLSKINKNEIQIENDFRELLAKKHKGNSEYYILLDSRPTIRHAIKFTLLKDPDFIRKGLAVGDIRKVFLGKGWVFTSRYISTSMVRNHDLVDVIGKRLIKGKSANVYGKRLN